MIFGPGSHEQWSRVPGLIAPRIWMHRGLLLAYRRSFCADFPKIVHIWHNFHHCALPDTGGDVITALPDNFTWVREINTYGLSRMPCTPKHLLSSFLIFLLNLHYLYKGSAGSSLLLKTNTPGSKPQRRVWAVFLGCLWGPHNRFLLPGIRQNPKGKNKLPGSTRIEESNAHKPLFVTGVVNFTHSCSFVQGTAPCGCASLHKHDLETQLPKKDLQSLGCRHLPVVWPVCRHGGQHVVFLLRPFLAPKLQLKQWLLCWLLHTLLFDTLGSWK